LREARPLRRLLQRIIETKLARALIAGDVGEGSGVTYTVQNDELVSPHEAPAAKK
jgi:ATP-dependent Clp protease ATP-binding subunit ClpB